jgi:hypothetical protein
MILAAIALAYGSPITQERPMKKIVCAFAVPSLLALTACGLDREQLRPASSPRHPLLTDATSPEGAPPVEGAETALPDSLRCVSAPLAGGSTDVLRVDMWRDVDGTFTASVMHGPQFWSHNGVWFGSDGEAWPTSDTRTLVENAKTGALVETTAAGTLTIALDKRGAVFTGTFEDDQCYVHTEATLTCWNELELFGSPWAGVPGELEARFDWSTGACKNADGQAARNQLPLAIVQETGFAECTDVSGRLNGEDLGNPDLVGWNLAGANLDDAELFFANLTSATLNGADLSGFAFGYATVSGSFDSTTVRPDDGECGEVESPWGGASLECRR